jgi:hypothetical protein
MKDEHTNARPSFKQEENKKRDITSHYRAMINHGAQAGKRVHQENYS